MEKKKKSRWFWFLGIITFISIGSVIFYSQYTEDGLTTASLIALVTTIFTFCGGIIGLIILNDNNKHGEKLSFKIDEVDIKVNHSIEKQSDFEKNLNGLSKVVMTITEKDIEEAAKFDLFYEAFGEVKVDVNSLSGDWNAKKRISNLGKKIQSYADSIGTGTWKFNDEIKKFLVIVTNFFATHIKEKYEYGFEQIDLINFEIILLSQVEINFDHINKKIVNSSGLAEAKKAVETNINDYIKALTPIQGMVNGKAAKFFENKTEKFIENFVEQTVDAYENPKKEIA